MEDTRIAELEAQVAELKSMVRQLVTQPSAAAVASTGETIEVVEKTSSRRGMLKLAGAATAGVVAAAVAGSAHPAAATAGDVMHVGNAGDGTPGAFTLPNGGTTAQSIAQTRYDWLPVIAGTGFLFQAGSAFSNNASFYPSALAGWTQSGNNPTGVYGHTNVTDGHGVVGRANSSGGVGVRGESVQGDGLVGNGGSGATSAGVRGLNGAYSLAAINSTKANLYLQGTNAGAKTVPAARADAHLAGELENVGGDLWWCVASGTPGTWRKISGAGVAGAYHALTPGRVYDSRQTLPTPGLLTPGSNRTISVADRRDANLSTGAVVEANFVPAGATAVAANVTVTQTTGSGYLAVNPGGNSTVGASTINWSGNGLDIANGVILTLDGSRQLTIIAGGGGSTHFVIDIMGYYL